MTEQGAGCPSWSEVAGRGPGKPVGRMVVAAMTRCMQLSRLIRTYTERGTISLYVN